MAKDLSLFNPTASELRIGTYLSGMRSSIYRGAILRVVSPHETHIRTGVSFREVFPIHPGDWSSTRETNPFVLDCATVNRWLRQGCRYTADLPAPSSEAGEGGR